MSRLDVHQIPVLNDNYVYLARCPETAATPKKAPEVLPSVEGPDAARSGGVRSASLDGRLASHCPPHSIDQRPAVQGREQQRHRPTAVDVQQAVGVFEQH